MRAGRCEKISACRGRKTVFLRGKRQESRGFSPAKTLTLGRSRLRCAGNAPPDGPAPVSRHRRFKDMAKAVTIKVKLVSSADTGFYYVAKKNSRTMTDKLVKKKYDPVARKHVEFREAKIK